MQLDLKKIPFGRRLSRHMLYEETDSLGGGWKKGLYLALAAESGGSFIGGPMMGPKGFALITPTAGGKDLAYTYEATPSLVTMKTEKGSVRFAIDGAKVLRIEGRGVGLRIDGRLSFGGICITTPRGIELSMGGIYLMTALKGSMSLDCHWDLKALRSTDPIITIEPDGAGALDLAFYDTDDAYELPGLTASFDRCAADNDADFGAFTAGLSMPSSGDAAFFNSCAYALWAGFQPFKDKTLVPSSKMADMNVYTIEQPIATLPMKDAAFACGIVADTLGFASPQGMVPTWLAARQNLYEAVPPVYAFAVIRLIENGSIDSVPKEKLSGFYETMCKTVNWWLTKRANGNGLVYYTYRHECNWPKEKLFGAGMPAAAPDLAAYIALAAEALSKIAALLGKDGPAAAWSQIGRDQLDILTARLWDGKRLVSVNAQTGEAAPAEGMLSLIPLILGKRLPAEIVNALAEKAKALRFDELPVIPAALIILGLKASGKDGEAGSAAATLVKSCADGGTSDTRGKMKASAGAYFSPAACAALLSVGGLL